jgi:hypothetical protein
MILKLRELEMRRFFDPVTDGCVLIGRLYDWSHRIGGEKWSLRVSGFLCRFGHCQVCRRGYERVSSAAVGFCLSSLHGSLRLEAPDLVDLERFELLRCA